VFKIIYIKMSKNLGGRRRPTPDDFRNKIIRAPPPRPTVEDFKTGMIKESNKIKFNESLKKWISRLKRIS
jgi:hypothetical protein